MRYATGTSRNERPVTNFRALAFCLSLLPFLATAAHAQQVAVYAAVDYTEFGFKNGGSTYSFKAGDPGFTVGGFYNFELDSRFTVGIDARNTYSPGTKGGDAVGVALRIAFVPDRVRLRPFLQVGGGVVSSTANTEIRNDTLLTSGQRYTNGAGMLDLGLDIRLTDRLDLRAIDYGAEVGGTTGIAFANVGLVYHLPRRR